MEYLNDHCLFSETSILSKLPAIATCFKEVVFLTSCNYQYNYPIPDYQQYACILGVGAHVTHVLSDLKNTSTFLDTLQATPFTLGYLSYDIKNAFEDLNSAHPNRHKTPYAHFIEPEVLVKVTHLGAVSIEVLNEHTYASIVNLFKEDKRLEATNLADFVIQYPNKAQYLKEVNQIKQHIAYGEVYELNFCKEFYVENIELPAAKVFQDLLKHSPNPFSAFIQLGDIHVMCASPERFLSLKNNQLLAQPIKGTSPRAQGYQDEMNKNYLLQNTKELAENVMIVDLIRNDLSKIAQKGSVKVQELLKVYSFPNVHQMISSITCTVSEFDLYALLKANFPMGSMTGAPKIKAMELSEHFEGFYRGVYSGSIGYINGLEKSFDFNVVIRSMVYNRKLKTLSFPMGSAITHGSDAEKEYEECLLKAQGVLKTLA